jgi:acetoin utilization deacetylase AcuC-like enzyme
LIALAHDPAYVDAYLTGTLEARAMRRIGFPWSPALARRTCIALGSSVLAAELALQHGLACSTAGGTHHAFHDYGSGFCIFNDLAVAARAMLQQGRARRVLIVDLDVHQGDGTAAILAGDPAIFTFSMHCGANFPFHKQRSDLDVDLPVGTEDDAYLALLAAHLPDVLSQHRPDLVLYDAGVDPHRDDLLGKLALSDAGHPAPRPLRDRRVPGRGRSGGLRHRRRVCQGHPRAGAAAQPGASRCGGGVGGAGDVGLGA